MRGVNLRASDLAPAAHVPAPLARACVYRVRLAIAGRCLEVRFDRPDAAEIFRRRYRHVPAQAPPHAIAYAAAAQPDGAYFWVEGDAAFRWTRCALGATQVAFLADAVSITGFFARYDGVLALHAAALGDSRSAVALLGASTAGKSTTALACVRRGLQLYSDEYCIVTQEGVMPFARALSLRRDGLQMLAAQSAGDSPMERWIRAHRGADRHDVGFDELFGSVCVPQPRPLRVAFAVVGTAAGARVNEIAPAQMLGYAKPWAKMSATGLDGVRALLALLQRVECYELHLGSPDETAWLICERLAACSTRAVA